MVLPFWDVGYGISRVPVNQIQRHREEHLVDIRAPPRHPDHPNGCSPLLRLFLCFMCASGCMICGAVVATATLAPFTILTPSNIQFARANTANVRDLVNALVDTPRPPYLHLVGYRIREVSGTVIERCRILCWKRLHSLAHSGLWVTTVHPEDPRGAGARAVGGLVHRADTVACGNVPRLVNRG